MKNSLIKHYDKIHKHYMEGDVFAYNYHLKHNFGQNKEIMKKTQIMNLKEKTLDMKKRLSPEAMVDQNRLVGRKNYNIVRTQRGPLLPRNVIEDRAKYSWMMNHWPENNAIKKRNIAKMLKRGHKDGRNTELGPYQTSSSTVEHEDIASSLPILTQSNSEQVLPALLPQPYSRNVNQTILSSNHSNEEFVKMESPKLDGGLEIKFLDLDIQ